MTLKTWNSKKNSLEEALELPKGRYVADFGGLRVDQSVELDTVVEAAQAILDSGQEITVASQAKLICKAQELELAFQDWAELSMA